MNQSQSKSQQDEMSKAIVMYRVKCDMAYSEFKDKFYSEQEYHEAIKLELDRVLKLIDKAVAEARIEAENYGRANEHHVISRLMDNDDLGAIKPSTLKALKRRQNELSEARYPKVTKENI